jgi:succinate dehydrogenase/fumarate reductase flavoprotein subunit
MGMRGARCRAARGPQAPHSPRHARARSGWHLADAAAQADGDKVVRAKVVQLLDNSPFIRKADTLTELAKKMEVDVAAFLATIERYNVACKQGLENEPEFGKPLKASKPFDTPPYYAVQIFPLARKNFAGVKTDLQCRVLDRHFEPIGGLYAAGEVAGMAGGHINGRAGLEGTMLGPSIFSGRVAGGWAAHGRGFSGQPNRT